MSTLGVDKSFIMCYHKGILNNKLLINRRYEMYTYKIFGEMFDICNFMDDLVEDGFELSWNVEEKETERENAVVAIETNAPSSYLSLYANRPGYTSYEIA